MRVSRYPRGRPAFVALALAVALAAAPAAARPASAAGGGGGTYNSDGSSAVRPVGGAVVREFTPPASRYGTGHRGVDLAAAPGEPVRAALAGTVAFAGQVAGQHWVSLDHGGGLRSTYGVLEAPAVAQGERVAAGDRLGVLAGGADHLDWGATRDGTYVDPLTLLGGRRAHLVDPERLAARVAAARAAARGPGTPGPAAASAVGGASGSDSTAGGAPGPGGVGHALLWPVAGRISSGFGLRTHPISGVRRLHAGVDVAAPTGTPVVAAAAGTVTWAGPRGGYGLLVVIDHGGGLETRYAHASALEVQRGAHVERGQPVARVGATGTATGPHLHYEVRVGGVARDPLGT